MAWAKKDWTCSGSPRCVGGPDFACAPLYIGMADGDGALRAGMVPVTQTTRLGESPFAAPYI